MNIFVRDTDLNVSAKYLSPGFAFGGSCLPKDVRALVYRGRSLDVSLPLLSQLLPSNDAHLASAIDAILETGARRVALIGLSFKSGTDDLRESPYVALAESLLGKGIELRIYDPLVNPRDLLGTNRAYIDERVPHVGGLLRSTPREALADVDLVIVASPDVEALDELLARKPTLPVVDLTGTLPAPVEGSLRERGVFQGLAW
jgi:GDP-mannose 6-dehydrogenase